jgi:hypothetical protein
MRFSNMLLSFLYRKCDSQQISLKFNPLQPSGYSMYHDAQSQNLPISHETRTYDLRVIPTISTHFLKLFPAETAFSLR